MGVDYEQQLKDNETALADELKKSNESFDTTASKYQTVVDGQMQQLEKNKEEQTRLQQEQTDFTIDQIEQKQEQAEKDYTKEQQAAYGDYKRQTDPYGANAEQMAALGLSRSGYSESANVAMYTAYQNRVATARASFERAKQTFDNAIREAKLTNDINLAKIAQDTMAQSLALAMDSVVYLGNLEQQKAATASAIKDKYYNLEQDILEAQRKNKSESQVNLRELYNIPENGSTFSGGLTGFDYYIGDNYDETSFAGTGNGNATMENADFTAVDAFIGNSIPEEEIDDVVAKMILKGIITVEKVNGVDVYKIADEEKARKYITLKTEGLPWERKFGLKQGVHETDPEVQPKYNYSDERVNEYFRVKDEVAELKKRYEKAKEDLDNTSNRNDGGANSETVIKAKEKYVDTLKEQLNVASDKLEQLPVPVESRQYNALNLAYKKAHEAYLTAEEEYRALLNEYGLDPLKRVLDKNISKVLKFAKEEKDKAKKAMEKAYEKLMAADQYTITDMNRAVLRDD